MIRKPTPRFARWRRLLALVAGLGVALACAELLLRARYDSLPSLAALDGAGLTVRAPAGDGACPEHLTWKSKPRVRSTPGSGAPLRVWFAGDSTSAAVGVRDEESWWLHVARGLAGERPVEAVNLAVPGAEPCGVLHQLLRGKPGARPPDIALVGVFADDLIRHQVFSVDAKAVLLPSAAPPWLRPLVGRSFAANLVWMGVDQRRVLVRERTIAPGALDAFRAATQDIAAWGERGGTEVVFLLIAPSGLHFCPTPPPAGHECRRLAGDMAQMHHLLEEGGHRVLDLRPWFQSTPVPPLAGDLDLIAQGRLIIPLHVAPEGQAALGDEVLRLARAAGVGAGGEVVAEVGRAGAE